MIIIEKEFLTKVLVCFRTSILSCLRCSWGGLLLPATRTLFRVANKLIDLILDLLQLFLGALEGALALALLQVESVDSGLILGFFLDQGRLLQRCGLLAHLDQADGLVVRILFVLDRFLVFALDSGQFDLQVLVIVELLVHLVLMTGQTRV